MQSLSNIKRKNKFIEKKEKKKQRGWTKYKLVMISHGSNENFDIFSGLTSKTTPGPVFISLPEDEI
jgi:hypothetical protein